MEQAFKIKSYGQAPTLPSPLDQTPHSKSYGSAKALGSGSSELATWYQEAYAWYNAMMLGEVENPGPEKVAEVLDQMNWAYGQLNGNQGTAPDWGNGDPMGGPQGVDQQSQTNDFGGTMGLDGEWVYDSMETNIGFTGPDSSNVVYGTDNTLATDMASAKVSFEVTQYGNPPTKVLKAIMHTSKGDAVYYYMDAFLEDGTPNPNFHLKASLADLTKVTGIDALPGKIEATQYDPNEATAEPMGDQPTNGSDTWDGDSFEIYSTSGDDDNTISARGTVNFHAASNKEYWTVEWDDANQQYVVKVYDDPSKSEDHLKKTFHVDKMTDTTITFDIDPTRIEFLGDLGDAEDPHKINTSDENGKKLSFAKDAAGESGNPDYPEDTPPATGVESQYWPDYDGEIAIYDSPTVDIHPNGEPSVLEIHANEVNINLTSMMDEITQVSAYSEANGQTFYQIVIKLKDGTVQTLLVDKDAKININGGKISEDQKVNLNKGTNPITLNGEPSTGSANANEILDNLMTATGRNEEQILSALKAAGFTFEDIEALKDALKDGSFPPSFDSASFPAADKPNENSGSDFEKLIKAIVNMDPTISGAINSMAWDAASLATGFKSATPKMVQILQALYPDHNIAMSHPNASNEAWRQLNNISFDGVIFNWTHQGRNHQSEVHISLVAPPLSGYEAYGEGFENIAGDSYPKW